MSEQIDSEPKFLIARSGQLSRRLVGGPGQISYRMRRVIWLMVYGRKDDPARTPLAHYEAGKQANYRRKGIRALFDLDIFVRAYEAERARLAPSRHKNIKSTEIIRAEMIAELQRSKTPVMKQERLARSGSVFATERALEEHN